MKGTSIGLLLAAASELLSFLLSNLIECSEGPCLLTVLYVHLHELHREIVPLLQLLSPVVLLYVL